MNYNYLKNIILYLYFVIIVLVGHIQFSKKKEQSSSYYTYTGELGLPMIIASWIGIFFIIISLSHYISVLEIRQWELIAFIITIYSPAETPVRSSVVLPFDQEYVNGAVPFTFKFIEPSEVP